MRSTALHKCHVAVSARYIPFDRRRHGDSSAEPTLVKIVVRIAHVRVFRLVTDFRREFRITAMDVRNV
jgi:hypothetical protein